MLETKTEEWLVTNSKPDGLFFLNTTPQLLYECQTSGQIVYKPCQETRFKMQRTSLLTYFHHVRCQFCNTIEISPPVKVLNQMENQPGGTEDITAVRGVFCLLRGSMLCTGPAAQRRHACVV